MDNGENEDEVDEETAEPPKKSKLTLFYMMNISQLVSFMSPTISSETSL